MKKGITAQQAKEFSIEKWELIIENDGMEVFELPEHLENLSYNCGFCEFAGRTSNDNYHLHGASLCHKCPIFIQKGDTCLNLGWKQWEAVETVEAAEVVLDLVKSIEV